VRAALVLLAAVVVWQPSTPAGGAVAAGNSCGRSAIDVPSCGLLWGMYRVRAQGNGQYNTDESKLGRRLDMVKFYTDFAAGDTFPTASDKQLAAGGRILYYSWSPVNYRTNKKVSYASIASGSLDASVVKPEAQALKAYPGKIFLDFSHEFDAKGQVANGTPAQFVAAYRHVHDIFTNQGVTNVIWSWVSTGWIGNKDKIRAGYPGASYVNWIGYDPYNLGSCAGRKWNSATDTLKTFYDWVGQQADMNGKPILLSEYAASNASGVQAWYSSLPSTLQQFPRIRAMIQFSAPTSSGCDTDVDHSSGAMAGFKQASDSAYVMHG
jgi:Glycosyl hydrolase family 26